METEYDFTNAEQGKFTRQLNEFDITVHLDSNSPTLVPLWLTEIKV